MIKNNRKKIFLPILLSIFSLIGCTDENENNVVSPVPYTPSTVSLTIDGENIQNNNNFTVKESEINGTEKKTKTFVIKASIAEPNTVDYVVSFKQVSGNATLNSDYTIDDYIIISAGKTSAEAKLVIKSTGDLENNENLVIKPSVSKLGVLAPNTPSINVNIKDDYINDELDFVFDWTGSYTYEVGTSLPVSVTMDYKEIDIDVIYLDERLNSLGYVAATSNCPEVGSLSALEDGTYYLAFDLYKNPFSELNTNQNLPVKVTYSQNHFIESTEFTFNKFNTNDTGGTIPFAKVEVVDGYKYKVTPL